jgi:hypothetical protein
MIRDELVRANMLPLVVKLDKSPGLASKAPVRVAVGEIDYWTISGKFSLIADATNVLMAGEERSS